MLHDPYAGLLLTVVANNGRVSDASLHYNLHTTDADVLQSAFSEHRNHEAHVIYVRESCTDDLRARCRRARATGEPPASCCVSGSVADGLLRDT